MSRQEPSTPGSVRCGMSALTRLRHALWQRWYVEAALYTAVAIASTWPLVTEIGSAIPLGIEVVGVVPLYSLWILWWHADRLAAFGDGYWDAPMFHPHEDVLGFSEPMFLQGWGVAPLWWAGASPALAYNLVVLVGLVLNGWAACRLLRAIRLGWIPALAGGVMVEMVPMVHQQLGVLPLLALFGVVWTIHATYLFGKTPTKKRGVLLGLAFGAAYLTCNHFALFLSIVLVAGGAWLVGRKLRTKKAWIGLLLAGAVVAATAGPVVVTQLRAKETQGFVRNRRTMLELSAKPAHYLLATWPQLVTVPPSKTAPVPRRLSYWPGSIRTLLALVAIGAVFADRRPRWVIFCTILTALAAVLSMGMHLHVGSWHPYETMAAIYPGLSQVRFIWRFTFFAQMGVALLAATGLEMLFGRVGAWGAGAAPPRRAERGVQGVLEGVRRRWASAGRTRAVALAVVATWAAFEIWPSRARLHPVPSIEANAAWIEWLEQNTEPDAVVAGVPFASRLGIGGFVHTADWLFFQTEHHRPTPDGYSSYFPPRYVALLKTMRGFPNAASLGALADHEVDYVVVRQVEDHPETRAEVLDGASRLERVFDDPSSHVTIYALREAP